MTTIADLRALHEAATPGPWRNDVFDGICTDDITIDAGLAEDKDANLIVAMRNMLPDLLACIEAADKHVCGTCGFSLGEQGLVGNDQECDDYRQPRARLEGEA